MGRNKKSNKSTKKQQLAPEESSCVEAPPTVLDEYEVHDELTNSNTNMTCLDPEKPYVFHLYYRYKLWTGLYMMNSYEQVGLQILWWLLSRCFMIYMFVLINGFRDGFLQSAMMLEEEAAESLMA